MRLLPSLALCTLTVSAQANVIQYFAGISYNNPSELFKTQEAEFLFGGTGSYANLRFKGSALNLNTFQYESGVNHSHTYTLWPYGRIAKRLNDKTVIALDVTEPFNSNLDWGDDTFTRYAVTQNYLIDVDISPKVAYSLSKKLQVGGGLNFNILSKNEVNFAFPTGPSSYQNLINKTGSFGLGYNLGATFIINQKNFLGATYYSRIRQNTHGMSTLGSFNNPDLSLSFSMPATTILSYVHIFNPKWLFSVQAFRSEWHVNQYVRLFNTAAPPPNQNFNFEMSFGDAYALLGVVRNQFTEKLGLSLVGMRDDGPEKDNLRTLVFPSDMQYLLGLSADYHFNKSTSIELLYGHAFSWPNIKNQLTINNTSIPFNTGKVNINTDVLDLRVKVAM